MNKAPMFLPKMQIIYLLLASLSVSFLLCRMAIAEEPSVVDVAKITELSIQPIPLDVTSNLDHQIDEFLNSPAMASFKKKKNTYIGYASEEVPVGPEDRSWGKHRVLAFERALIKAENQYVENQGLSLTSEKLHDYFEDGSGNIPAFNDSELNSSSGVTRIFNKLQGALEGRLDQTLEELGIDPREFDAAPKKQRTYMLKDSLKKDSIKKATASLAGMTILKTFEGEYSGGKHAIGVVIIVSPSMRQTAHDILTARGNIQPIKSPRKPIRLQVENLKGKLLTEFGVRTIIDEYGYAAIISYGQWSNAAVTKNERVSRRFRAAAEMQARAIADQNIALFLNGVSMYESESEIGNSIENYVDSDSTGFIEEQYIAKITDILREKTRSRSKAKITGLKDLYRWTMKHPRYGHEIVGVVRIWSPATEKSARNIREWSPKKQNNPAPKDNKLYESSKSIAAPVINSGEIYMQADDF